MAKEKRSAADLDAELAALEAELAALEGKAQKAPKAKKERKIEPAVAVPAPAPAPETERPLPTTEPAAPAAKKSRFAMPTFGKKHTPSAPVQQPGPEPATPAKPEPTPEPPAAPVERKPAPASPPASYDASVWRQEEGGWTRVVPETRVPVIRRVLDDAGNVVREEPAELREVEDVSSVKAERGLGRLLRRK